MKRIRLADAKAHFSQLIASLKPGTEVTITRHGIDVARITPVTTSTIDFASDVVGRLRARAKQLALGPIEADDLVAAVRAGRR